VARRRGKGQFRPSSLSSREIPRLSGKAGSARRHRRRHRYLARTATRSGLNAKGGRVGVSRHEERIAKGGRRLHFCCDLGAPRYLLLANILNNILYIFLNNILNNEYSFPTQALKPEGHLLVVSLRGMFVIHKKCKSADP